MNRADIYGRGQALHGDKTTSGATLISTLQQNARSDSRGIVRRGDPTTTCPKCGKPGVVVEGDSRNKWRGEWAAVDGHIVSCGCPYGSNQIIAPLGPLSPNTAKLSPVETGNSIAPPARHIGKPISHNQFDLQFLLTDSDNGKPRPNTPYRITMENGTVLKGVSDKSGLTKKIFADSPLKATIEAPNYEPAELINLCTDTCQH
ncbi:PAAR domain-containing protein [Pseudomonas nicosulfuronedens]